MAGPEEWSARLEAAAAETLGDLPAKLRSDPAAASAYAAAFEDEQGTARTVDRCVVAHALRTRPAPADDEPPLRAGPWRARRAWLEACGVNAASPEDQRELFRPGPGSLVSEPDVAWLEAESEASLAALHAASHLSRVEPRRLAEAARWLMDHVQPDNATNRPWACHVFVRLAERTRDASALLYADTLLHNCRATAGRADLVSAWILVDAAAALRET